MRGFGQLHHDDADVLHHGQASILRKLSSLVRSSAEKKSSLVSLVTPSTPASHLFAERFARTCSTVTLVCLHYVVQEAGLHGDRSPSACRRGCGPNHDRMHHVRLSARIARHGHSWYLLANWKAFCRAVRSSFGRYSRIFVSNSRYNCWTGSTGKAGSADTLRPFWHKERTRRSSWRGLVVGSAGTRAGALTRSSMAPRRVGARQTRSLRHKKKKPEAGQTTEPPV